MLGEIKDIPIQEMVKYRKKLAELASSKGSTGKYLYEEPNANTKYVKYTHMPSVYKIIESDSLYCFCSELSNDFTENKAFYDMQVRDAYISSFYQSEAENAGDIYSQWLAYCSGGGAAFEFYLGQATEGLYGKRAAVGKDLSATDASIFNYSLLCSQQEKDSEYYIYPNIPLYVQYYNEFKNDIDRQTYKELLDEITNKRAHLLVPYFKDSGFVQENEARLAFLNINSRLNKLIKFMDKSDGTKVPYIEVKFGDLDLEKRPCKLVEASSSEEEKKLIEEMITNRSYYKRNEKYPIIIPQGYDQERVYDLVEAVIKNEDNKKKNYKIICQGHLPITKITLAPMRDSAEQKKKLEIFCQSKYWLRNVEICESKIPYNTSNNNH